MDQVPLRLKLVGMGTDPNREPKFYQKYFILKREKFALLMRGLAKQVHDTDIDDVTVAKLAQTLDELMTLQGSHYFVVNLDEEAGQEAMIRYWELKGHSRQEILSCLPRQLRKT
jgi:hypothetical protein